MAGVDSSSLGHFKQSYTFLLWLPSSTSFPSQPVPVPSKYSLLSCLVPVQPHSCSGPCATGEGLWEESWQSATLCLNMCMTRVS